MVIPAEKPALTVRFIWLLVCPSGFRTRIFHVSAVVLVVIGTVNWVELTNVALVFVLTNV